MCVGCVGTPVYLSLMDEGFIRGLLLIRAPYGNGWRAWPKRRNARIIKHAIVAGNGEGNGQVNRRVHMNPRPAAEWARSQAGARARLVYLR